MRRSRQAEAASHPLRHLALVLSRPPPLGPPDWAPAWLDCSEILAELGGLLARLAVLERETQEARLPPALRWTTPADCTRRINEGSDYVWPSWDLARSGWFDPDSNSWS